ncbi:hypothetical protein B0H13DRAFT_2304302 [Mycena leptocephala]|nr:hypothetical protein B0H13DRAFT_2304302 [Mycena leptocephala]
MAGFRMICDIILLANIWTHDGGLLIIATKARFQHVLLPLVSSEIPIQWDAYNSGYSDHLDSGNNTSHKSLSSFAGLMQLILFLVRRDFVWTVFYFVRPKVFSNSMLAV